MSASWESVSREDLIEALQEAHRRLTVLEDGRREADWLVDCLRRRTRELDERMKELECLYCVNDLLDPRERPDDARLRGVLDAVAASVQRPASAYARLELEGRDLTTPGAAGGREAGAEVEAGGRRFGRLVVGYRGSAAAEDFLPEERRLLSAVAARLATALAGPG